ncbi:transcriptional accessory protein [Nitzschia inconspicua]|uniref:Transcriptional accessory protein n=1 Tax=Nitzschia inconspicua TaxID=303405 RepID=A0A9K3K6T1_9STRA|nr:transcriptional accessory protein [Nitzschia inconspicua]KAG7344461.1 transcriptional accessory protein [Nitzschia inconspicua]
MRLLQRRRDVLLSCCASIASSSQYPFCSSFTASQNVRQLSSSAGNRYSLLRHRYFVPSYLYAPLSYQKGLSHSFTRRHLSSKLEGEVAEETIDNILSAEPSSTADMNPHFLARSWISKILQVEDAEASSSSSYRNDIQAATARTIPFFLPNHDSNFSTAAASVPFVCRYRTDIIRPLSTQQVHVLQSLVTKHSMLQSLRDKLLVHFPKKQIGVIEDHGTVRERILASTSKTELEDLYAPFKPPSKGSILERIQSEHPQLVTAVEALWQGRADTNEWTKAGPREVLIQLLATKIAAEPQVTWMVLEELRKHCRIQTRTAVLAQKDSSKSTTINKYSEAYGEFFGHLEHLKDHQVLAIRRGVNEKALKMTYDIDSEKMEKFLVYQLRFQSIVPTALKERNDLFRAAVHDAWTRLLRRRGTTRLWSDKCKEAQDRACQVFEDNLRRALLAPPYPFPSQPILALDPGFAAGIKCAVLDADGNVDTLETVKFVGGDDRKQKGVKILEKLIKHTQTICTETQRQCIFQDYSGTR